MPGRKPKPLPDPVLDARRRHRNETERERYRAKHPSIRPISLDLFSAWKSSRDLKDIYEPTAAKTS